jgi:hypothetical protein
MLPGQGVELEFGKTEQCRCCSIDCAVEYLRRRETLKRGVAIADGVQ